MDLVEKNILYAIFNCPNVASQLESQIYRLVCVVVVVFVPCSMADSNELAGAVGLCSFPHLLKSGSQGVGTSRLSYINRTSEV
ncbi:hypothetical protein HAX54_043982, partial [Datura stramonium]|nr:hypothetical protein [Datura stramonium]